MKRILIISMLVLVGAALTACGGSEKRKTAYLKAEETKSLNVPAHLDPPRTDTAIKISVAAEDLPPAISEPDSILPPLVISDSHSGKSGASIRYSAHGAYVLFADTAASSWRRIGLSLPRLGLKDISSNVENQSYDFDFSHQRRVYKKTFWEKMKFWSGPNYGPDYSGRYRLKLVPDGTNTRAYLQDTNGNPADSQSAGVILTSLLERVG